MASLYCFDSNISKNRIAKIRSALIERALSAQDIEDELAITVRFARAYIHHIRAELYIERWDCKGSYPVATYRIGVGIDAPKPAPKQLKHKRPKPKHADLESLCLAEAMRRAKAIKPRRDPLVEAFFGAA